MGLDFDGLIALVGRWWGCGCFSGELGLFCGIWSFGVSLVVLCDNGACARSVFRHMRFLICLCICEPLSLNRQVFTLVFSIFLSMLVCPGRTSDERENVFGT